MKRKLFLFLCSFFVCFLLLTGCPGIQDPPTDGGSSTSSRNEVTNLSTTYSDGAVLLFYTEPSDDDFAATELTFSPVVSGVTQPITLGKGEGLISDTVSMTGADGLTNGTEYTFTLKAVYSDDTRSAGLSAVVTPSAEVPKPINVSAAVGDGSVTLSWDEPAVNNWFDVTISFTPEVEEIEQPLGVFVGTTSVEIDGLSNGTEYTFTIVAYDFFGLESDGVTVSAAPSEGGAVPEHNCSSIFFIDTDGAEGSVTGSCIIEAAEDESDVEQYLLYWGGSETEKLSGETVIATLDTSGGADLPYEFSSATSIPSGASHLLVFSRNAYGEATIPTARVLEDLVLTQESYTGDIVPEEFDGEWYVGYYDAAGDNDLYIWNGSAFAEISGFTEPWVSIPESLTAFDDRLMLIADYYDEGEETTISQQLWEFFSDNTAQRVSTGGEGIYREGAVHNGEFYFPYQDGTLGTCLYRYDGENTPEFVYDCCPDETNQNTNILSVFNDELLFVGTDWENNVAQLYAVDDSDTVTVLTGFSSGTTISLNDYAVVNDIFYFIVADDDTTEIYGYDGSSNFQATNLESLGGSCGTASSMNGMYGYQGNLYFVAYTPIGATIEMEAWVYDGSQIEMLFNDTGEGEGYAGGYGGVPYNFMEYNGYLIYNGSNEDMGHHLYIYDGVHDPVSVDLNTTDTDDITYNTGYIDDHFVVSNIDDTGTTNHWRMEFKTAD